MFRDASAVTQDAKVLENMDYTVFVRKRSKATVISSVLAIPIIYGTMRMMRYSLGK